MSRPKVMRSQPLSVATPEPGDVSRDVLVEAFHADPGARMVGGYLTTIFSAICWEQTGAATPLAIALATFVFTSLRIFIANLRQRPGQRLRFERAFSFITFAYIFCCGVLPFWAYTGRYDDFILTLSLSAAIINTMAIAFRAVVDYEVAALNIASVVAPVTLAFLIRGGMFYFAALTQAALAWYVYTSAKRLREIFLSEFDYRLRTDTMAKRFRFAIDNMSHGMLMIDRDRRIVVSNARLAHYFNVPPERNLQGVRFSTLLRLAQRRHALSADYAHRLLTSLDECGPGEGMARLEMPGAQGRVHDVTVKRNDEGGWVLVVEDVTDERQAREALDRAARFDAMTGLPNRRSFEGRLAEALGLAGGTQMRTEALFLDLDGFKQINDTLGHKYGDRVLAEAARRLRCAIRDEAYVARWGGDEFVILRSGPDDNALHYFASRLIDELSRPMWIEGTEVVVGASLGAAICVGGAFGPEALLQQADMALYSAKREARGSCRLYEATMSEQAHERRLLELDLQAALAARSFELHYQPIVDIETGELVSFEALARWRHPTRGNVSPALFVPVLEDLNLMTAFGSWALQRACEDAAQWPLPVRVGVNVSTRQIDTVYDSVRRALGASGLAPSRLELEITETAALAAPDVACRVLESVRALGVKVALDDFGTGYSSLSHLMRLPLDKVKIDKSFTQQLGVSRKADVLVANIARLSSQLGMRVTFEGVETEAQLDCARALGVSAEGQGWLFGRPMPMADLHKVFAAQPAQAVA